MIWGSYPSLQSKFGLHPEYLGPSIALRVIPSFVKFCCMPLVGRRPQDCYDYPWAMQIAYKRLNSDAAVAVDSTYQRSIKIKSF